MNPQLQTLLKSGKNRHVLYSYTSEAHYIQQAVNYVLDGMANNEYVLVIDNERLYPRIEKEVQKQVSKEDFALLHFVKNFDFYLSSGSYHPPSIIAYFNKIIEQLALHENPFRSWAHVEWATLKEPLEIVRELEEHIDWAVSSLRFSLICAYRLNRMPSHLSALLEETHPYLLTDETFQSSSAYLPKIPVDIES